MSMLRVLKWIAITFIVVVAAAVLYLSFADLNWLKPRIESAVADATGRELKLSGAFDLDIVPSPAIVLEDVSLSNAEWGSAPELTKIGHFSARLGFWSLLFGPARVKELRLRDVDLLLETNAQGEANWVMGAAPEPEPAEEGEDAEEGGASLPVIIEFAEIRNIKTVYKAPEAEDFVASLEALDITTDEAGYMVLDGKGEVRELALQLSGKLGPGQALTSGRDIDIDLNTNLGNVNVKVDGTTGDLATLAGIDLKAVASSDDVAQILKHLAVELPLTGALNIKTAVTSVEAGTRLAVDATAGDIATTATATRTDGVVQFEVAVPALDKVGAALEIEGLPARDLAVDGRIVTDPQAYQLQGISARLGNAEVKLDGSIGKGTDAAEFSITAGGPSLADFGVGLPELPFKAALTASLAPEHMVLDGIETTFGESDLGGTLDVRTGDKTAITGQFKSKRLDLTPFAAADEESEKEKKPAPEAESGETKSQYVFVEEPLSFDELNKTDVDFKVDIDRFILNNIVLVDASTALELKGGNLQIKNRFAGPKGGKSVSGIALTTAGKSAELDIKVNMRDLRVNLISGDVKEPTLIPPVGVTLDIKSTGSSPRALASSANGRFLMTQGKGQIQNDLVGKISGDIFAQLFSSLNPFSKNDKFTTLECTIFALEIANGKADIAGMYSQGEKIKVVGDGDIDLNTEALKIEFNTKPRKGIGVSADMFVTPFVNLTGTLASPKIGLNKKGALLAVGTGGLSVLVAGIADRAAGEKDRCAEVLAEVGDHPPMDD